MKWYSATSWDQVENGTAYEITHPFTTHPHILAAFFEALWRFVYDAR